MESTQIDYREDQIEEGRRRVIFEESPCGAERETKLTIDEGYTIPEESGGSKYDGDWREKPRMDLLPPEALFGAARAFSFGATKYDAHNWRKGIKNSRLLAAALRHISQHNMGETSDDESDLYHIDHALACLMMVRANLESLGLMDDRYVIDS